MENVTECGVFQIKNIFEYVKKSHTELIFHFLFIYTGHVSKKCRDSSAGTPTRRGHGKGEVPR